MKIEFKIDGNDYTVSRPMGVLVGAIDAKEHSDVIGITSSPGNCVDAKRKVL